MKNDGDSWDLIVIGSGFGSLFFLKRYLERRPSGRVLILERGQRRSAEWQAQNGRNSDIDPASTFRSSSDKAWNFTIGVGGGTNCWWGLTPRLHPSDFTIRTDTGVSADWPLGYDDLAEHYTAAESIMNVAGPDDLGGHYPGANAYPQPPHRLTTADRLVKEARPDVHFAAPGARLSRPVGGRSRCCATANCSLCPVNAKFSAVSAMTDVLDHPSVTLMTGAEALQIDAAGGVATGVLARHDDGERMHRADLIVLGANAIHAPYIMLRSGLGGDAVGRYLGEKMQARIEVYLDGLKHFDGGTVTTGMNLAALLPGRTAERGAAIILFDNYFGAHGLRAETGRWREVLPVTIEVEDLLDRESRVTDGGDGRPMVTFPGHSHYAMKGLEHAMERLEEVTSPLPVEEIRFRQLWPTSGHLQGTLRMGADPDASVVDADLRVHDVRNLLVVGTSTFPTVGSGNPSLTAAALSLRAADRLLGAVA